MPAKVGAKRRWKFPHREPILIADDATAMPAADHGPVVSSSPPIKFNSRHLSQSQFTSATGFVFRGVNQNMKRNANCMILGCLAAVNSPKRAFTCLP